MEYFYTCGRGTETYVTQELNEKFPGSKTSQRDGKVFLSVMAGSGDRKLEDVESLLFGVRTAERCFVTVIHDSKFASTYSKSVASQLRAAIHSVEATRWEKCFCLWKKLQRAVPRPRQCSRSDNTCQLTSDDTSAVDYSHSSSQDIGLKSAVKRPSADLVTFRVSAKCAGKTLSFNSQTLARYIGPLISHASGWIPDLRKPDLEVYVQLNRDGLVVGLSACRAPLSARPYLKHIGLRTTVASVIASLAGIQPGMLILDPMCGEATILIEAAKHHPGSLYIGGDNNFNQCVAAVDNVSFAQEMHAVHIVNADFTALPLHDASVDAVVSDIPFGAKHGTVDSVRQLIPQLVPSLHRLLKVGGRAVLLVGAEFRQLLLDCVGRLNDADMQCDTSKDSAQPFCVHSDHVLCGSDSDGACDTNTDLDSSCIDNASVSGPVTVNNDNIMCTKCRQSTGEAACCTVAENCPVWTTFLEHYVKLGETHAYICGFAKNR